MHKRIRNVDSNQNSVDCLQDTRRIYVSSDTSGLICFSFLAYN